MHGDQVPRAKPIWHLSQFKAGCCKRTPKRLSLSNSITTKPCMQARSLDTCDCEASSLACKGRPPSITRSDPRQDHAVFIRRRIDASDVLSRCRMTRNIPLTSPMLFSVGAKPPRRCIAPSQCSLTYRAGSPGTQAATPKKRGYFLLILPKLL